MEVQDPALLHGLLEAISCHLRFYRGLPVQDCVAMQAQQLIPEQSEVDADMLACAESLADLKAASTPPAASHDQAGFTNTRPACATGCLLHLLHVRLDLSDLRTALRQFAVTKLLMPRASFVMVCGSQVLNGDQPASCLPMSGNVACFGPHMLP